VRKIWFLGPSYLHQMFPYESSMDSWNHWYITGYFRREPLFVATRASKQWSGAWVIWTHKTPLVCLAHGMKLGFQVLGPWGKCQSLQM
jgi:hypothetical protein